MWIQLKAPVSMVQTDWPCTLEVIATALGVFMFFLSALAFERGANLGDAIL